MISHETVLAVDIGKSRSRVATWVGGVKTVRSGLGTPGLAAPNGAEDAMAAIMDLIPQDATFSGIGVGIAGAFASSEASDKLASMLASHFACEVVVASDVVTAHAGALSGHSGVLLVAGTGAVAIGITADDIRLVDGWGPDLGDFGSGAWIGREALRSVLRSRDGLGPETSLTTLVAEHLPPGVTPITWMMGAADAARRCGSLAPIVLAAATDGDGVAQGILAEAVSLLATTTLAAAQGTTMVAVHGGLTESPVFSDLLGAALRSLGLQPKPSSGDALDGAALLLSDTSSPHEKAVHRAH